MFRLNKPRVLRLLRFPVLLSACLLALVLLASHPVHPASGAARPPLDTLPTRLESLGVDNFRARVTNSKRVKVLWETGSELEVVGFYVWRRGGKSESARLSPNLIPASNPGMLIGSGYKWKDKTAVPGKKYFYKLEIATVHGFSYWLDEIKVKVK